MYTDEDIQQLYNPLATPTPVTSDPDTWTKRVEQVANILPNVVNQTAQSITGLGQALHPEMNFGDYAKTVAPAPTFDVGPTTGISDVLLNRVAPSIAAWMIPYSGVSKVLKGAEVAAPLVEGVAQGAANYFTSSGDDSQAQAGVQGLTGLASGILQAGLPRIARALPLAAVSGANAYATGNPYGAAANFIFNMLPGAHGPAPFSSVEAQSPGMQLGEGPIPAPAEAPVYGPFNSLSASVDNSYNSLTEPTPQWSHPLVDTSGLTLDKTGIQLEPANNPIQDVDTSALRLQQSATEVPPSGLRLDYSPTQFDPSSLELPQPPSELNLEGAKWQQPALHPLLDLQSQSIPTPAPLDYYGQPPLPSVDVQSPKTGDLFDWAQQNPQVEAPSPELPTVSDPTSIPEPLKPDAQQSQALPIEASKAGTALPSVEAIPSNKVQVITPDGTPTTLEGRMPGPHIVSTVLDEGDGKYLAGQNWNDPHGQSGGQPSIFEQHIEDASGLGESKFVAQDAQGNQRVVGRQEGAVVAEQAGQRKPEMVGRGPLQSQDLQNPSYTVPKQLLKLAKSPNISDIDLASELGHYDDGELKSLSNLVNAKSPAPEDVATALKEQYGPNSGGDKTVAGQQLSTKGRSDALDSFRENNVGMKKGSNFGLSGKVSPEYVAALGLGTVGGLVAYKESKGDIGVTLTGAILGMGLGLGGTKAIRALMEATGPEAKAASKVVIPNETIASRLKQFAADTSVNANGAAVTGRGGLSANSIAKTKALFGIGEDPIFRDKKLLADGFIARELDELTTSLVTAGKVKASPGALEAFGKYFRGQLADPVDILSAIQRGGGTTGDAWDALSSAQKAQFPEKWMHVDDANNTNTKGNGVTIYHVTNQTKQQLTALQDAALTRHLISPADLEAAKFFQKSRAATDAMMGVIHAAVPPGTTLNRIIGTMGQYAARMHDVITDPNFWPDEQSIRNAMSRMADNIESRFFNSTEGHAVPQPQGSQVSFKGQVYNLTKGEAEQYSYLHTPESLKSLVEQHIVDLKRTGAMLKSGQVSADSAQLGTSLFTGRKDLDEVTQALLGTHTDPFQMVSDTINKLVPSTRSAHIMQGLLSSVDEAHGVPFSFSSDVEYNKALSDIKMRITQSGDPVEIRGLQNKLERLTKYAPVSGQDAKMGLYQGSWMSPEAHQFISGQESPLGILDNAFGKTMANFNQMVKATHLILNPAAHARLFFQIPALLAMGGAAADPGAWKDAFGALKDLSGPIGQKLLKNGVLSTDMVKSELNHGVQELLDGSVDKGIWGKINNGYKNIQSLYTYPDHFVRAASFLAEENRQLASGATAQDAQDAARAFMSRRTLDYNNIPQYVKIGRDIPFVSMFLGYTHEITRVAKNMVIDAAHGDLGAGMTLGALGAGPFMLQNAAESALSTKDRTDWEMAARTAPAYSRPRFKLPLSRNPDGSFNYVDVTPFFHFNDFEMFARSVKKGDWKAAGEANPYFGLEETPLINLFSEAITGQDEHTGKEYRNGWDYAKSVAQEVLPPLTPGIGTEYQKIAPESAGGELGVTNMKTARTNSIQGALLRNLVGADYTQINPAIAESNTVKEAQHEIANERQYYVDTVKQQGLSADAKDRAKQRFLESVQHISFQLHQKISPNAQ